MEEDLGDQTPSGHSQLSTSAGTGSGTTPQSQTTPAGPSTSASSALLQLSKRRRGLGIVTPNACTECRKKRAKVRCRGCVSLASLCACLSELKVCLRMLNCLISVSPAFGGTFWERCGRDCTGLDWIKKMLTRFVVRRTETLRPLQVSKGHRLCL
jgi:hypothetical protein